MFTPRTNFICAVTLVLFSTNANLLLAQTTKSDTFVAAQNTP